MTLNVYAMYDRLEGSHRALVTSRSDARASRDFCNELLRLKKQMEGKAPIDLNDYELHKLGTFDDETGLISALGKYEVIPLNYPKEE